MRHLEGDEWDFKETLGDLSETSVRVKLARNALAFCNLPRGGTLVVGIADDYSRVGLKENEILDTTRIRNAVEKYIDGDFTVDAAEHEFAEEGGTNKRFGTVHFERRTAQPVIAAKDGDVGNKKVFIAGDIFVRRGARSIRANSGDVRRLLTNSVVNEERVKAANELWACVVGQRQLLSGAETLYQLLDDSEYSEVIKRPNFWPIVRSPSELEHVAAIQDFQQRASMTRPYLSDELFEKYRRWSAFMGRVQWKVTRQFAAGVFRSWVELDDGEPDLQLHRIASQILTDKEIKEHWAGRKNPQGTYRPLTPVLDLLELNLLELIRAVLLGVS